MSALALGMMIDPLGFLGPIFGLDAHVARSDRLAVRLTRPPSSSDPEDEEELGEGCPDLGNGEFSTADGIVGVV